MAFGTSSNFILYPEQFWGGVVETVQQNAEGFNAASANALRLVTRSILGEYERESFLKSTSGLVQFRDVSSTANVADIQLNQGEMIGVKVNRTLGPVAQDRDSFRKIGVSPDEFSFLLGQQFGPEIAVDYINTAVGAVRAAIANSPVLTYDNTTGGTESTTLNHAAMVNGIQKFGDRAARIKCWIMHSKQYFDLMRQQIADKLFEVAGATVYAGTLATFGKPVVVTDSTSLYTVPGSGATTYDLLGLVENAIEIAESEERDIISQPITGQANLADRIQGEYAFNVRVKGCQYNTTAGHNPTNALLYTPTNWVQVVADAKEMPGIRVSTL